MVLNSIKIVTTSNQIYSKVSGNCNYGQNDNFVYHETQIQEMVLGNDQNRNYVTQILM